MSKNDIIIYHSKDILLNRKTFKNLNKVEFLKNILKKNKYLIIL